MLGEWGWRENEFGDGDGEGEGIAIGEGEESNDRDSSCNSCRTLGGTDDDIQHAKTEAKLKLTSVGLSFHHLT